MALWEETIPLMIAGRHKEIKEKAYSTATERNPVYPPKDLVFNAMRLTPFDQVKVVIIGQDPYINERNGTPEAHGLCFSVREGLPMPPSLRNIFKEIQESIYPGESKQFSTDLSRWSRQGVLLLNASLSVVAKQSNSHVNLGWHQLTDDIIATLSKQKESIVFLLWGAFAQKKEALIDQKKHCIIKTSHPSPLSAHRGFLGSKVFVRCNEYLQAKGKGEIEW